MPKIVERYTPPPGADEPRPSVALQCDHCAKITWVFSEKERSRCGRCGRLFVNQAGTWLNLTDYLAAKKSSSKKD